MNADELYKRLSDYGKSELWQTELADELGTSQRVISKLAQARGYWRHRLIKEVKLEDFSADLDVKAFLENR